MLITKNEDMRCIANWIRDAYNHAIANVGFAHSAVHVSGDRAYRFLLGDKRAAKGIRFLYSTYGMYDEFEALSSKKQREVTSGLDVSIGSSLESVVTPDYYKENRYIRII